MSRMPMMVLEGDPEEAREAAYACLDAMDAAPPGDRPALALKAIRADPTLLDGYLAAADVAPQHAQYWEGQLATLPAFFGGLAELLMS